MFLKHEIQDITMSESKTKLGVGGWCTQGSMCESTCIKVVKGVKCYSDVMEMET